MKKQNGTLKNLEFVGFDFDGIFTDATVDTDEDGKESVRSSRRDGVGLKLLKAAGIGVCVISMEQNPVVAARCKKMEVESHQVTSPEGKVKVLQQKADELGLRPDQMAFMGDDRPDLPAMHFVGVAISVSDGDAMVMGYADFVTDAKGGERAVREIADAILASKAPEQ